LTRREPATAYRAVDLDSREVRVQLSGACAAVVRVSERLSGEISGACSLEYIGDPAANVRVSGAGSVRRRPP